MWNLSDESLLAGLGSGDPGAASAFVGRFERRVFGLTRSILRDRGAAEEAAQEAFVRAWKHASAYDPRRGTVAAWLLTIARNVSINMLPTRRFDPVAPEVLLAMEAKQPPDNGDPAQVLDAEPLREGLARLPAEQRRPLVLAAFYGFTAREISELDGVPLGTVKTRIRRLVAELSSVGDELLQLAPEQEPPMGFESRVLAKLAAPPRRRPLQPLTRRSRWAMAAAAAVLVAALGAGSVVVATADDRRLADSYRTALSTGEGSFFSAAPLQGPQGRIGSVFGYQGRPSWVMMTLQPSAGQQGRYQVQVVTQDGRYLPLGEAVLSGAQRSWGAQLPVDLSAVRQVRCVGSDGRTVLTATFDPSKPWN